MPIRKLPVGIQTFEEIRNNGYLYVDKTKKELFAGLAIEKLEEQNSVDESGTLRVKGPVHQQITEKGCDKPYLSCGKQIVKIGVVFDPETRTITEYKAF